MSEDKDNLAPEASTETPSKAETQVETLGGTSPEATEVEEKVYAGKFKSAEDLEKSYKELESKLGSKTYSKELGDKVLEATGYTEEQLVQAGYKADDIVKAMIQFQDTGKQQAPAEEMGTKVVDARVANMEWKLAARDFYDENPDAKGLKQHIEQQHALDPSKSPEEIYNQSIKPLMDQLQKSTEQTQSVKEKAALNLTNQAVPETDKSKDLLKRYQDTRHIDDAGDYIAAKLFGKK